ncbi:MAG: aminotransferase class V-fold PLP-dependent enzyme [Spirochaetales bacterium]|nr:aminotransferase class V-fold PLP-dependent enzyme [Spirochaetales bacterium]
MSDINWDKIYNQYPVNQTSIWLNNCGTTPAGSHIIEAVTGYIHEYSRKGVFSEKYALSKVKNSIQAILSELLNCDIQDIALIHNTAEGMNFISRGLSLNPGDEILLMENEYPSNVYPWEHWQNKGITIKFIASAFSPGEFIHNFKAALTDKTKLVSLSAVHWCTGLPLPIKEIGKICQERAIDFCVDGAQGAGHVKIDVNNWGISYLSFSAWKWLLGPLGLGVLVIPEKNVKKLEPVFKGTGSVAKPQEYLPYQKELIPGVERYMFSTPNFIDWIYFLSSLEFLQKIGFERIMERIYRLSRYLTEKLMDSGFTVLSKSYLNRDYKNLESAIVLVGKEKWDVNAAQRELSSNNIITAVRLDHLRMAPHIYNSFDQLDKVIELLNGSPKNP